MTQNEQAPNLVAVVAGEVRRHRKARKMSAQQLADACTALGVEMQRGVLANLEIGRRESLDVTELVVLAKALDVPPIALLFPVGHVPSVSPTPGVAADMWDALAWFTGETPLSELPPADSPRARLEAFRHHAVAVEAALASARLAHERRRLATVNLDPAEHERLGQVAAQYERLAFEDTLALRDLRARMRDRGLEPPVPPVALAHIDDSTAKEDPSA
ncbi:helix-turn-helix transcriptional regulator [Streptomyces sp. SID3343]|uniref:helix-turn-helix domain-containing protein n=1 Tax=Streptomyces sp. SID3343 TaxID=2690260 RepID=UPI00136C6D83|nr:helix-turn-helix transcriptional regulator [Streptomyces sp. SID3343]MYW00584.1 XRE family transcriptional regulator [Streptomyces sp. SID3343]